MIHDTTIVFSRELRPVLRDPFSVIFTMVQPLFFLVLFSPLLPEETGLQWFVPGMIVMSCLFGAGSTGGNLLFEMQTGSHERMLVSPLRRSALIVGRALKEIVPTMVHSVLIIAITIPFGFRPHAGAVFGLLLLAIMCVGLGALSYSLALASKNKEWIFWAVQQTISFPLLLLAGMLLPIEGGPAWLQFLSKLNPLSYLVNAERELFNGEVFTANVGLGLLAAVGVAALGLWVGTRQMRHAVA
ncbi:ABC transporter permease [Lentzea flava]|uniref:Transport permease protein n=1 Tax=Lentzea flava TaxID=103732 RepID=A0ABQ2V8M0_9PSEU|nr:ABC transporter permease [Lentzea flava]MCP2203887.1 ABC-2 type transport system permease protein [Lentzea flava]GGU72517.1 transport permease protein [Lentzea flava]